VKRSINTQQTIVERYVIYEQDALDNVHYHITQASYFMDNHPELANLHLTKAEEYKSYANTYRNLQMLILVQM
jgi:hypothetical protein